MNRIHEGLLSLCSVRTQKVISDYKNEYAEIERLKKVSEKELHEYVKKLIEIKYELNGVSTKKFLEYYIDILTIEEKNITVNIKSCGEIHLIYKAKYKNPYFAEVISTEDINRDFQLSINIKKQKVGVVSRENVEDYYNLNLILNSNSEVLEIMRTISDLITLNSIFPVKRTYNEEIEINKLTKIINDISSNFNNNIDLIDIMALKYDANYIEDDILSIVYQASRSVTENRKGLKRKFKN